MKTGAYEVLPTCSNPMGLRPREAYEVLPTCNNPMGIRPKPKPLSPFELHEQDASSVANYAEQLRNLYVSWRETEKVTYPANTREQYKDLSNWNRELHDQLVATLEKPYVALTGRIMEYAINNQHQLERHCQQVPLLEVPYEFTNLPPNLFDHYDRKPFIPDTDEGIIRLVSEYMLLNRRLSTYTNGRDYGHALMDSVMSQGFDVMLELQRRRKNGYQFFTTEEGQRSWEKYSWEFQREARESHTGSALARNAIYSAYRNNRLFSEEGGFFEVTDKTFGSFWLVDFESKGAFTSQIRVPIGWYGPQPAKELALGAQLLMTLVDHDIQFEQDIKKIAHDPELRPLCQKHLLRSRDRMPAGVDPVEYGIKHTYLEGILSVKAAYAGLIEADGIPGYETDLWGGLSETLKQKTATAVTARMPAGYIAATTIWGRRIGDMLTMKNEKMRIRPEADARLEEIRKMRIAKQHAAWLEHRTSGVDSSLLVRLGLYCPFKSDVVMRTAETLMVCRAIASEAST